MDTFIVSQKEDTRRLTMRREQVLGTGSVRPDDEDEFEKKAREKIEIGEEELSGGDEDSEAKATKVNLHIFVTPCLAILFVVNIRFNLLLAYIILIITY